jgi:hypothetical protein
MARIPSISGIIARQVGSIQGKLTTQVQGRVLEILSKFSNQCPDSSEIKRIITQRNNLLKVINAFEKRVNNLRSTANRFNGIIRSTRLAIQVIKNIPIPTAIIPPMSGGLGIPINILTRYSDALIRLNKLVDGLEADRQGILGIVDSTSNTLVNLKQRLNSIDLAIQQCSQDSTALPSIVLDAQPKENTGTEGTPGPDYEYKGYRLEILQDISQNTIVPRRYAIAKDRRGIIVLKGPLSFSSSTDVLLDEIKFRIDNQLS